MKFEQEVKQRIIENELNKSLVADSQVFMKSTIEAMYSYNFSWMGRPIIQYPQDMIAMQELIWEVKPDLVIETGIAHGGSLIMNASYLAMLDYCDAIESNTTLDPSAPKRRVLGIDIDIREHNKKAIKAHPMSNRIDMIQGSSIDKEVIDKVHDYAKDYNSILISLDSNHTHEHVLAELKAYAPLTSKNSYCIVFDTVVDDLPTDTFNDRPWGVGNNPKTAVWEYLKENDQFIIDKHLENKLLITVAPDGFLKRVK